MANHISSLRSDLADAVLIDLMENEIAVVVGPASTVNRVAHATASASKTFGTDFTMSRTPHGWVISL